MGREFPCGQRRWTLCRAAMSGGGLPGRAVEGVRSEDAARGDRIGMVAVDQAGAFEPRHDQVDIAEARAQTGPCPGGMIRAGGPGGAPRDVVG